MKASELRLGNSIRNRGKISKCEHHMLEMQLLWEREQYSERPPLMPIPLSEFWLIKLGAKEVNSKIGILKRFELHGIKIDMSNSGNFYISQTKKPIFYVHKIQNLIFELKDIEITIKPSNKTT